MRKIIFLFIVLLFSFFSILPKKAYAEVRCSIQTSPEPVPIGKEFVTLIIQTSGLNLTWEYRITLDDIGLVDRKDTAGSITPPKHLKPDSNGTIRIDNMTAKAVMNPDDGDKQSFDANHTYEVRIRDLDFNEICMATFNVGTGDTDKHTPSQPPEKSNPSTTNPNANFVFTSIGVCAFPKDAKIPEKLDPTSCNTTGNYDDIFIFAGRIIDQKYAIKGPPNWGGTSVSLQYFPIVIDGEWQDFNSNDVKTLAAATTDSYGYFKSDITADVVRELKDNVDKGTIAIEASANVNGGVIYGCTGNSRTESTIFDPSTRVACMVFYINPAGALSVNLPIPSPPCAAWKGENCSRVNTAFGSLEVDPTKLIGSLFGWALGISGVIAFLIFLYAGYQLMTSAGNKEKVQGARDTITSAIVGLLFIIFSIAILEFIGVDILRIPGLGK